MNRIENNLASLIMRQIIILLSVICLMGSCKDEGDPPAQLVDEVAKFPVVKISTSFGDIHLWLFEGTPLHRENFLKLAREGFYDSTEFHRIIPNFMIQGGDPNSKNGDRSDDGTGGPGYTIPAEIDTPAFFHHQGSIAAARIGDKDNPSRASSGSQFYIVTDAKGAPHLNGAYTVFGEVISGLDIALTIQYQKRNLKTNLPNERIPMAVSIIDRSAAEILSEFGYDISN